MNQGAAGMSSSVGLGAGPASGGQIQMPVYGLSASNGARYNDPMQPPIVQAMPPPQLISPMSNTTPLPKSEATSTDYSNPYSTQATSNGISVHMPVQMQGTPQMQLQPDGMIDPAVLQSAIAQLQALQGLPPPQGLHLQGSQVMAPASAISPQLAGALNMQWSDSSGGQGISQGQALASGQPFPGLPRSGLGLVGLPGYSQQGQPGSLGGIASAEQVLSSILGSGGQGMGGGSVSGLVSSMPSSSPLSSGQVQAQLQGMSQQQLASLLLAAQQSLHSSSGSLRGTPNPSIPSSGYSVLEQLQLVVNSHRGGSDHTAYQPSLRTPSTVASLASTEPSPKSMGSYQPKSHPKPAVDFLQTMNKRPKLSSNLRATCPLMVAVTAETRGAELLPLPITSLHFDAQCHICQAFVSVEMSCTFPRLQGWRESTLLLFCPKTHDTTITDLVIDNVNKGRLFATTIVPVEDVARNNVKTAFMPGASEGPPMINTFQNDPELFMLPMPSANPGDTFKVSLLYFHPLFFEEGRYVLQLPSTIPSVCLLAGSQPKDVLSIDVTINTGIPEQVQCTPVTHRAALLHGEAGSVKLRALTGSAGGTSWDNVDFECHYKVWGDAIVACATVQPPEAAPAPQEDTQELTASTGAFAIAVSPPSPDVAVCFPRSVVFLVDRSGSMQGEPMHYAKKAILGGLSFLTPDDEFCIGAFDHECIWWSNKLQPATAANIADATSWINNTVMARGLTQFREPLDVALTMLSEAQGVPFVFLLTDGCVEDEREVCNLVRSKMEEAPRGKTPRVCTFAIGPYCNHFFMKQLATLGRGVFDVAYRPYAVQAQMQYMLSAAARPVLVDIGLELPGPTAIDVRPYPIPDLFCGMPLLVTGAYKGSWGNAGMIVGNLPSGQQWRQALGHASNRGLPLHRVFAKQQLDIMIADAWMKGMPAEEVDKVQRLSIATGVPCALTSTVGFETTKSKLQEIRKQAAQGKGWRISKLAVGGVAGAAVVAGVTTTLAFGDLASTLSNLPIGDVLGGVADQLGPMIESGLHVVDCCACFGADCGACSSVCHSCCAC